MTAFLIQGTKHYALLKVKTIKLQYREITH